MPVSELLGQLETASKLAAGAVGTVVIALERRRVNWAAMNVAADALAEAAAVLRAADPLRGMIG